MKVPERMIAVKCKRRVFVTGMGVVSPLGPDVPETERALLAGKDAVSGVALFDVSKTRCKTAGQVEDAWLSEAVPRSRKANRLHRSARMVTLALREALSGAGAARPERAIIATSSGGMSNGETYYREALRSVSRRRFATSPSSSMRLRLPTASPPRFERRPATSSAICASSISIEVRASLPGRKVSPMP